MEDSWDYWLSHLGMSDHAAATTTTTSPASSLSFEEIISLKGSKSCDDSSKNVEEAEKEKASKRGVENSDLEEREKRGTKKARGSSEALDHVMSERKRRKEMAERFIALSATIPGLKKIDKASVLQEAINYVKQLKQRIAELEQETSNKKSKESLIVTKPHLCSPSCETNHDHEDYDVANEVLPEVEARELEKEVLIRIHCEKRKGIMLKLLAVLENNHLSVASSSLLPFGNSALNIIIIAQMTEGFSLTVNDLVKTLKKYLVKFKRCNNCGPC